RRARAVLAAGENDQRDPLLHVLFGGVPEVHLLAVGQVAGPATLALHELVAQPHVGERATHHHFVVAAPRAVRVVLALRHLVVVEVLRGRRALGDGAGRRDVVRRHGVTEEGQDSRVLQVLWVLRRPRQVVEERGPADVGRLVVPGES